MPPPRRDALAVIRVDAGAKLVGETGSSDGEDHFFLGFPSYWNVVAFYAIVLDASPTVVAAFRATRSYPAEALRYQ